VRLLVEALELDVGGILKLNVAEVDLLTVRDQNEPPG
jgi:hypothetical protein